MAAPFADALEALAAEGVRADVAYLDLGMSSMQVDEPGRGFSYAHAAPLDMRMDPTQGPSAARRRQRRGRSGAWRRVLRDFGEERYADRIARAIARERARAPITTTDRPRRRRHGRDPGPGPLRRRPPRQAHVPGRCGSRSTTSSASSTAPCRPAWQLLRGNGRFAGISFHSLEDRRVKRFLAARAQGCICPPDLPVCACGRTPEAEILTRRSVTASPEEVAVNPRAKSARLRAARKLERSDQP